jgi:hypothetical protein
MKQSSRSRFIRVLRHPYDLSVLSRPQPILPLLFSTGVATHSRSALRSRSLPRRRSNPSRDVAVDFRPLNPIQIP